MRTQQTIKFITATALFLTVQLLFVGEAQSQRLAPGEHAYARSMPQKIHRSHVHQTVQLYRQVNV